MLLTSSLLAASTALAPGLVARVADRPITKADHDHWYTIAATVSPNTEPGELRKQVTQLLVSFEWIDLEGLRLGVSVSPRSVEAEFRRQQTQSFPTPADFEAYLQSSGQTVNDLKRQIRADLGAIRIRDHVMAGARTRAGQARRFDRYVPRFTARYRRMTACGTGYYTRRNCVKEVPLAP